MKKRERKGFTIVELVIVIAIIAILAAVLIPTFAGLVAKAQLSADQQAVTQMNIAIAADEALDGKPESYEKLADTLRESGFSIPNKPISTGYDFVWDKELNRVFLLNAGKAVYPADVAKSLEGVSVVLEGGQSADGRFTSLEYVKPAVCEHEWGEWTTNETTHTRVCNKCGVSDSGDHDTNGINGACSVCGWAEDPCKEGHTVTSWQVIKEMNCANGDEGIEYGVCIVCNQLQVQIIPAEHNYVYYKYAGGERHFPYCTSCCTLFEKERCTTDMPPYTDTICSICNGTPMPCAGKTNYKEHLMVKVTTSSEHDHTLFCEACGWAALNEVHDTDGEMGACSKCGYEPCKHEVESWTTETEATCTANGKKTGQCTKCNNTITQTIPAIGHNILAENITAFDYFNHEGECSNCHEVVRQPHSRGFDSEPGTYTCTCGVVLEITGGDSSCSHTSITQHRADSYWEDGKLIFPWWASYDDENWYVEFSCGNCAWKARYTVPKKLPNGTSHDGRI